MVQAITASQAPHIAKLMAGIRTVATETGSIRLGGIMHHPRLDDRYGLQRAWARELTDLVRSAIGERASPRTVLYPFSGADLSSAVAAFPDADAYILVDYNPFLAMMKSARPIHVRSETGIDYSLRTDRQSQIIKMCRMAGGTLPLILGRLHAFLGDVRVEDIEYFVEHGVVGEHMVHGLMTFVQGESQRSKTLVYLNCPIGNPSTLHDELWKAHAAGVDGLLVRGTAGVLRNFLGLERLLVDSVRAKAGVIVEGAHMAPTYELSDEALGDQSSVLIEGFQFSYVKGMRITSFA